MDYFGFWQAKINASMQEFAQLAATNGEIDLRNGLLATALLWPIKVPVQNFDGEAMDAVREIAGGQTKHILKAIQGWDDDRLKAVHDLEAQAHARPEMTLALSAVINRFDAAATFSGYLAQILVKRHGSGDVYNISEQIKAALVNIGGVTNIESLAVNVSLPEKPARVSHKRRNELALLNKVHSFWVEGVLEHSLHGTALLDLTVEEEVDAVNSPHPWEMVLDLPNRTGEDTLPPSTRIIEIYDGLEKEGDPTMLILGEPGAGKTITLLDLARDTIIRAEQVSGDPLPVVFNLSSWGEERLPLTEWLVEELNQKYQIPKKIGRSWLENQALLLLLDGLDEVRADIRDDCVEAINAFQQENGLTPIVVCSRIQEYETLRQRLQFQRAVRLLPLSPWQVDDYLQAGGEALASLRLTLEQDENLRELAHSPLMLNIMSLAYRDIPTETLRSTELQPIDARKRQLFGAYVKRMFRWRYPTEAYTPAQTIGWLSWLAKNMTSRSQSVFLLENLQPIWIAIQLRPWYYLLTRILAIAGVSAAIFVIFGIFFPTEIIFLVLTIVITGIVLARIDGSRAYKDLVMLIREGVVNAEGRNKKSFTQIWRYLLLVGLTCGLPFGLYSFGKGSFGFIFVQSKNFFSINDELYSLCLGLLVFGIPYALLLGLRGRWPALWADIRTRESLNINWRRLRRIVLFGCILPGVLIFAVTQYSYLKNLNLILRDAQTGKRVWSTFSLMGIYNLSFSPDGTRILTKGCDSGHYNFIFTCKDSTAQLWDGRNGALIREMEGHQTIDIAIFSPDGTRILTVGCDEWGDPRLCKDSSARLWDGHSGALIQVMKGYQTIDTAIFSPDGTRILTVGCDEKGDLVQCNDSTTRLWDGRSGVLIREMKGSDRIYKTVFSPDGARILTADRGGNTQLWDGHSGGLIREREGYNWDTAVFSPDGTRILTYFCKNGLQFIISGKCDDSTIRLLDVRSDRLLQVMESNIGQIDEAIFSPDGTRILTSGVGIARLLDGHSGELIREMDGYGGIYGAVFSKDGTRILTHRNDAVQLWDGHSGVLTREMGGSDQIYMAIFSPDGTRILTVGCREIFEDGCYDYSAARLWDVRNGAPLQVIKWHKTINTAVFNPDGTRILMASNSSIDYRLWTLSIIPILLAGTLVSFQTDIINSKKKPNVGIHLTFRNALLIAMTMGFLVFVISSAVQIFFDKSIFSFSIIGNTALISSLIAWLLFLGNGGIDVIYHYCLRLLLALWNFTPWRYTRFLDYCTERIFLQKVGGGYIFVHRLLLEYFASLTEKEITELAE